MEKIKTAMFAWSKWKSIFYLKSREEAINPAEFGFIYGDVYSGNTIKEQSVERFKVIDPDNIIYEKPMV